MTRLCGRWPADKLDAIIESSDPDESGVRRAGESGEQGPSASGSVASGLRQSEIEIIIGNRQLLFIFGLVIVLMGGFFTAGYLVGHGQCDTEPAVKPVRPVSQPELRPEVPAAIEFVNIPPGEFVMGFLAGKDNRLFHNLDFEEIVGWIGDLSTDMTEDCRPRHRVKIKKALEMSKYEVTERQWSAVHGDGSGMDNWPGSPHGKGELAGRAGVPVAVKRLDGWVCVQAPNGSRVGICRPIRHEGQGGRRNEHRGVGEHGQP